MKSEKEICINLLKNNHIYDAKIILKNLEKNSTFDIDILYLKSYLNYLDNNINKAKFLSEKILNIIPLHIETNILLAYIYIKLNKTQNVIKILKILFEISEVIKNNEESNYILNEIKNIHKNLNLNITLKIDYYVDFGKPIENYKGKIINNYCFDNYNAYIEKILEFSKNCKIEAYKQINNFNFFNKEYILPIYAFEKETLCSINNTTDDRYNLNLENHYYFLRLKDKISIETNKKLFIANPIPCFKFEDNKDLVLTIFVDGLSQKVIEEYGGLEILMPHTYEFFKDGISFSNCYVNGEWTYVSIASFFTGQYTTNHKLFHPKINGHLRDDVKILSEYINEKNYFNAKIDGDWRSSFPIGYYRGFDRILYEQSLNGSMCAKEIPSLLIEHMEAFKETNMYIFTCIPDLHDIADGFTLPLPIQTNQTIKEKPISIDYEFGKTSVKNNYSETKIKSYIRVMKYIDTYLKTLYTYIEDNFDLDNVTISLISDHGQGFLIKPEDEFLSDGRTKVPLLIKSKELKNIQCDEYIQNVDYISIMDKILNLNVNYKKIDAILPKCLGGNGREYTYSESLFPEESYKARININNYEFYFETIENVEHDGRVIMEQYNTILKDINTKEEVINEEITKKCIEIVFEHMKYNRIYI